MEDRAMGVRAMGVRAMEAREEVAREMVVRAEILRVVVHEMEAHEVEAHEVVQVEVGTFVHSRASRVDLHKVDASLGSDPVDLVDHVGKVDTGYKDMDGGPWRALQGRVELLLRAGLVDHTFIFFVSRSPEWEGKSLL
jgi:hypothetical protein